MIDAQIIIDSRVLTKKGYRLRIRLYEIGNRSYRHISLNKYQNSKDLIIDMEVRKYQFDIDEKLLFCNRNNLNIDAALDIFKNGIPVENEDLEIKLLEAKLNELKKKRSSIGFLDFYKKFIDEKIQKGESVNFFNSAYKHFDLFLKHKRLSDIDINSIDYSFVNELDLYFKNHKTIRKSGELKNSTINDYFLRYSIVFSNAQNFENLFVKNENPFKLIKRKAKDIVNEKKNFTLIDLRNYYNLDLENYHQKLYFSFEKVRQINMFQFLIGGHDFEDISLLKWSDIKNDRIEFKRYKNRRFNFGGKEISNMIHPLAFKIINEIGTKNDERIFSFINSIKDNPSGYRLDIEKFNNTCRKIEKFHELSDSKLRSKTMRYTFRTIAGNLMINTMIIENIMGHSNSSISMGYQGATPYEIQDAEHLKVIEAVFGKKETP